MEIRLQEVLGENEELKKQLADTESRLSEVQAQLEDVQRQYAGANCYIETLRAQLDAKQPTKLDAAVQVDSIAEVKQEINPEINTKDDPQVLPEPTKAVAVEEQTLPETKHEVEVVEQPKPDNESTKEEPKAEPALSIAESLKQAAEEVVQQSGFVFDEKSGLYYDYNSGYYYDAEKSLYYDPNTGTYFYLDPETNSYQFHSQVDVSQYYPQQQEQKQQQQQQQIHEEQRAKQPNSKDDYHNNKPQQAKRKDDDGWDWHAWHENGVPRRTDGRSDGRNDGGIDRRNDGRNDGGIDRRNAQRNDGRNDTRERPVHWLDDRITRREFRDKIRDYKQYLREKKHSHSRYGKWRSRSRSETRSKSKDKRKKAKHKEKKKDKKHKKKKKKKDKDKNKDKEKKDADSKTPINDIELVSDAIEETPDVKTEEDCSITMAEDSLNDKEHDKEQSEHGQDSGTSEKDPGKEDNLEDGEISMSDTSRSESPCSMSDLDWFTSDEEEFQREERQEREWRERCDRRRRREEREREREGERQEEEMETEQVEEELPGVGGSSYPPCVRVMVQKSEHLTPGSLYIITCTGASLGREAGLGHAIEIPDVQVSKMHCDLQYEEETAQYVLKDHASQNGTFLNGTRISEPKSMSALCPVKHGDIVTVGSTTLALHIHPGSETCEGCEPGLVQAAIKAKEEEESKEVYTIKTKREKDQERKRAMKSIKKKYGLEAMGYVQPKGSVPNSQYEDKAEIRRQTVGSDNPHQKDEAPASVDVAIPEQNKGHKLLAKMGWKEGDSLGKTGQSGITEPIQVSLRSKANAGLGSSASQSVSLDDVGQVRSKANRAKAADRYHAIVNSEVATTHVATGPELASPELTKLTMPRSLGDSKPAPKKPAMTWVKGETQGKGGDVT